MSCTETCLRAGSIKLTNGIDSGLRIPPCVYFACVRIPGAREDSHSLRNQLIWDTTASHQAAALQASQDVVNALQQAGRQGRRRSSATPLPRFRIPNAAQPLP